MAKDLVVMGGGSRFEGRSADTASLSLVSLGVEKASVRVAPHALRAVWVGELRQMM